MTDIRSKGIGASEVASVIGVNPYQTSYQLWRIKAGIDNDFAGNIFTEAGHYLEPVVAQYFQDNSGHRVIKNTAVNYTVYHPTKEFIFCHPDREYFPHDEKGRGVLECKTTQKKIEKTEIPRQWFCQLQYQMGVMGLDKGAIAWLSQGVFFDWQEFEFAPDLYEQMCEMVEEFWTKNVLERVEPDPENSIDIEIKYPTSFAGKEIEAAKALQEAHVELSAIKDKIGALKTQEESLKEQVKLAMRDAEAVVYCGEPLFTWKTSKQTYGVDQKTLKLKHPDVYEEVLVERKRSRPFLVK